VNPFLWSGPAFLLFYLVLGIILIRVLRDWMRENESRVPHDLYAMASDPYRIAYLRGSAREAIKVVTIALIDRGLLITEKRKVQLRDMEALKIAQRPIEKEVLRHYYISQNVHRTPTVKLRAACDAYRSELTEQGLLLTSEQQLQRWLKCAIISGCLLSTTVVKLDIAFQQGRHNVLFLIILTALFIGLAIWLANSHRTTAGNILMNDLRTFFARLKVNSHTVDPGGATNEAALLAAVFGVQFLPHEKFPFVNQLYPISDGSGGSSSSGDSGDSGDSGGGSCGSGCGSGCGGCGGG